MNINTLRSISNIVRSASSSGSEGKLLYVSVIGNLGSSINHMKHLWDPSSATAGAPEWAKLDAMRAIFDIFSMHLQQIIPDRAISNMESMYSLAIKSSAEEGKTPPDMVLEGLVNATGMLAVEGTVDNAMSCVGLLCSIFEVPLHELDKYMWIVKETNHWAWMVQGEIAKLFDVAKACDSLDALKEVMAAEKLV